MLERIAHCLLIVLALCAAAMSEQPEPAASSTEPAQQLGALTSPRGTITWCNGDTLEGRLQSMDASGWRWQSNWFAEPLQLLPEAVHRLQFPERPQQDWAQRDRRWQVAACLGGNQYYGEVTRIDRRELWMDTQLYGTVRLRRDRLISVTNPGQQASIYSGPDGLQGWKTLTYGRRLKEWTELPGGRLQTRMVAAELYRPIPANGSVEIDLEVQWKNNPSFQLRFLTPYQNPSKETIKVETRAEHYVVQALGSNGQFRQWDQIPKHIRRCRFLLRWNASTSQLTVYREHRRLGTIDVARQPVALEAGLFIKNTGPLFRLNRLEIRAGNSLSVAGTPSQQDAVLLADGDVLRGTVLAGDDQGVQLRLSQAMPENATPEPTDAQELEPTEVQAPADNQGDSGPNGEAKDESTGPNPGDGSTSAQAEATQQIRWDQIAELRFETRASQQAGTPDTASQIDTEQQPAQGAGPTPRGTLPAVQCVFHSGDTLSGTLLSVEQGRAKVRVTESEQPLEFALEHMVSIVAGARTVPPPQQTPVMIVGEQQLHGEIGRLDDGLIGWQPLQCVSAASIREGLDAELFLRPQQHAAIGSLHDDLIYLQGGDVMACRVAAADEISLQLNTQFARDASVHPQAVRALTMAARAVPPQEDFDGDWQVKRDQRAAVTPKQLRFTGATTAQRDGIMKGCDQVEFVVDKKLNVKSGVFLNVRLSKSSDPQRPAETAIPFYFIGDKTYVMGGKRRNAFVPVPGQPSQLKVRIETRDPFAVWVNDQCVCSQTQDGEADGHWDDLSFNLSFSAAPMIGKDNKRPVEVNLSKLRISQTKRPSLSHVAKKLDDEPLLTTPRNHPRAATHVVLGLNGDALRGRLLYLDSKQLRWEAAGRQMRIARDAVAGVVRLGERTAADQDQQASQLADAEASNAHAAGDVADNRISGGDGDTTGTGVCALLVDTTVLSLQSPRLDGDTLAGRHAVLGECQVPLSQVQRLFWGSLRPPLHQHGFLRWSTKAAREPWLQASELLGHQVHSDWIGRPLTEPLTMLDGTPLKLASRRGQILVLQFWASWHAQAVRSMPQMIECVGQFPAERVRLLGVNQGEDRQQVQRIVTTRRWQLECALDPAMRWGRELQVDAIPRTVVIGRDGNVAAVLVGTGKMLVDELSELIRTLLQEPPDAQR